MQFLIGLALGHKAAGKHTSNSKTSLSVSFFLSLCSWIFGRSFVFFRKMSMSNDDEFHKTCRELIQLKFKTILF